MACAGRAVVVGWEGAPRDASEIVHQNRGRKRGTRAHLHTTRCCCG